MGIDAISAVGAGMRSLAIDLPSVPKVDGQLAGSATSGAPAVGAGGSGQGFGDQVLGAMESLNDIHQAADDAAIQAATGDLSDVHEYTIAASQAEIATQLTVAVRDKAVGAFNEIMRMQV